MEKQIIAACEITDHEVRLILAEIFNTRLHILKVERVACSGFNGQKIEDEKAVIHSIHRAVENASKNLGASIRQVLLLVPSVSMKHFVRRVQVESESMNGVIGIKDVQKAFSSVMKLDLDPDLEIINAFIGKYIIDGISFRRFPVNEQVERCVIEADIYCIEKELAYQLAGCVEKAGVTIMDVILDSIGFAKEAALLERSMQQAVIGIILERNHTHLSLYYQGKCKSSELLPIGMKTWIDEVSSKFKLPKDVSARLLTNNLVLSGSKSSDAPIYLWSYEGDSFTMSYNELISTVEPKIQEWRDQIVSAVDPIIQAKTSSIVISGSGGSLLGLDEFIAQSLSCEVSSYVPQTLGVRDPALTSITGAIYAYKDLEAWRKRAGSCVDVEEYNAMIYSRKKSESMDETISKKLKGIFEPKKA